MRPLTAVAVLLATAAALLLPGTTATAAPTSPSPAAVAAGIPGTAWSTDPDSGAVRVLADETVTDEEIARLTAAGATVERTEGTLSPLLRAGEAVYGGGARCTAGLNAVSGSAAYVVTAGHCTEAVSSWYADAAGRTYIGPTTDSVFPSNDFGLVRYENASVPHPGEVSCNGTPVPITRVGTPAVGQSVTFAGATSGCRSGVVTGLNATINYGNGDIVSGLIRTNICAEPGDSGGLLFSGNTAYGILSGGSGSCATGGVSYFQPLPEVMSAYGLSLP